MPQREFLLLSATEADRSGLVADLTGYIADRGCNVEDSRIAVLGGYAGLMVLLSGEPAELRAVLDDLEQLREQSGIRAVPRRVAVRRTAADLEPSHHVVEASAIDHEGIIHALAEAVRRGGGNILELESTTEAAPMSGEPLFTLRMSVRFPDQADQREQLGKELEAVAQAQGVELDVRPVQLPPGALSLHGPERRAVPRDISPNL
jgi:glycine cleavage system transcriptional repressor